MAGVAATLAAGAASRARAQARINFAPPVSLLSSPSSPAPGSPFTVTASTPTFDPDTASFSWTVDGRPRPEFSGVGARTIPLTAGAVGSPTRVSVVVTPAEGEPSQATLAVIPSELTLTWTADSSVPAWYRGKALVSPGSAVVVAATPRIVLAGSALNPDTLIYRWRIDSGAVALAGAGKRVFRFTASQTPGATHQIDVSVEDRDGGIRKDGQVLIENNTAPKVVLYLSSPLGGVLQGSAGRARAAPGLVDIVAEPYYFPASPRSLTYSWTVGGTDVNPPQDNPRLMTINGGGLLNRSISVGVTARLTTPLYVSRAGLFDIFFTP